MSFMCVYLYIHNKYTQYTLGMGRFPDSLGASAKKVKDAMHRFKKCASDTSWHFLSRCIIYNIFALVKFVLFKYNY